MPIDAYAISMMLRKVHLTSEPSARSRAGSRLLDRSQSTIVINDPKEIGETRRRYIVCAHSTLVVHWHNRPDCRRSLYYVDGLILMSSDVKRLRVIVNLSGRSRRVSRQITWNKRRLTTRVSRMRGIISRKRLFDFYLISLNK